MAISLTHAFTSLKSDGADPTVVQASNWNAQHVLTQSVSQKLLGRSSAGSGPTEEIGLDSSLSLSAQILGVLGATGSFTLSGSNTPTALSASVDDYNPANLATTVTLRIDGGAADRNITGIAGGADGRLLRIINIGATNSLVLKEQNTSSSVQNRFSFGGDLTIGPGQPLTLQYDNASSRWRAYSTVIGGTSVQKTGDTMSGALNWATAVTLASAGTTDIGTAASNYIIVTGTTTITALGTVTQGAERIVRFNAALTLTHNASSLILPGAANITTAAGDVALFVSEGSGNWRCAAYMLAGTVPPSKAAGIADLALGTNDVKFATAKALFDAAAPVTLTDAATITPDFTTGINFTVTLGGNRTLANPSAGMTPGRSGVIRVVQDATGTRTLAYGNQWKFAGGTPTLSTAANTVDHIAYYVFSSSLIYASLSKAFA